MGYACGLPKPSGALSTTRKGLPKPMRQALFACIPRTKSLRFCTLYQAEGRVFLDWEASEATQVPQAHKASSQRMPIAVYHTRPPRQQRCSRRARTNYTDSQTLARISFASAAKTSAKVKRTCQEHPNKRRRRAPSRAPNSCKYLPQRITHENREPWPTPTSLNNRSRRPRRRKKKPRPRPPP